MAELIWTQKAVSSLEDIAIFISKDSEFYAKKTIKDIYALAEKLRIFPLLVRIVPEYDDDSIKEIFYKSYRVIYKIEESRVVILTVISGYIDLTRITL